MEIGGDILPPVIVSIGDNASHAEVIDGKIVVGQADSLNLSDFQALQRNTFQEDSHERNFFNLEPGRVMYNTLIVYSKAHKNSKLPGPKVVFIRMLCHWYLILSVELQIQ